MYHVHAHGHVLPVPLALLSLAKVTPHMCMHARLVRVAYVHICMHMCITAYVHVHVHVVYVHVCMLCRWVAQDMCMRALPMHLQLAVHVGAAAVLVHGPIVQVMSMSR